jgi:hypothetical protein
MGMDPGNLSCIECMAVLGHENNPLSGVTQYFRPANRMKIRATAPTVAQVGPSC